MTLVSDQVEEQYIATGGAVYPVPFKVFSENDLGVYVNGVRAILNTDYAVTDIPNPNGPTVVFTSGITGTLFIRSERPYTQEDVYDSVTRYNAARHEASYDKTVRLIQQLLPGIRVFPPPGEDGDVLTWEDGVLTNGSSILNNKYVQNFKYNIFNSGTDFTPGVTTQLTINFDAPDKVALTIGFDGIDQFIPEYSFNPATHVVTFTQPIPLGVMQVQIKGPVVSIVNAFPTLEDIAYSGNANDLIAGTIPDDRFPSVLPVISGLNVTNINASNLASGTIPDARFPATLPALNGSALTNLNASNIASGTLTDARLSANVVLLNSSPTFAALTVSGGSLYCNGPTGSTIFLQHNGANQAYLLGRNGSSAIASDGTKPIDIEINASRIARFDSTGSLILGTDPGGSELLRVGGAISTSNNINLATGSTSVQWINASNNVALNGASGALSVYTGTSAYNLRAKFNADGSFVLGTDPIGSELVRVGGGIRINSSTLIATSTSFTNGAGASAGTLTNAPAVGNPTKWIPINDNGTTRYIPAW